MTQRERTLLGGIVALVALWAAWRGYSSYESAFNRRDAQLVQLEEELLDQQVEARRARQALRRLESYQERSLPSDPEIARSVYAEWLKDAIQESGLQLDNVKWASTRAYEDAATALTFTAAAKGAPDGVARLLDAYYRLDVLHQLTNLQLRPASEEGREWSVALTSVALVVEGGESATQLPEEPIDPPRLNLATADDYAGSIAGRNLFATYTPPPPPRPEPTEVAKAPPKPKPSPPPFDDAKHAQLSGIVQAGAQLQAWVWVRTTGEMLRLQAGDELDVGQLKGKVHAVLPREMVVESEGDRWRVRLGQKLREAEQAASGDA